MVTVLTHLNDWLNFNNQFQQFQQSISISTSDKNIQVISNCIYLSAFIRVAQLLAALTTNREVGGSSPGCAKLTKSFRQAFNPKLPGLSDRDLKLGGPVYHNNTVGTLKTHLCPSHIGQVQRLPGSVSQDVLRNASLRVTLAVQEVVDTENWVNSTLSCFDPSSIAKMQSYSSASDGRLLLLLLLLLLLS